MGLRRAGRRSACLLLGIAALTACGDSGSGPSETQRFGRFTLRTVQGATLPAAGCGSLLPCQSTVLSGFVELDSTGMLSLDDGSGTLTLPGGTALLEFQVRVPEGAGTRDSVIRREASFYLHNALLRIYPLADFPGIGTLDGDQLSLFTISSLLGTPTGVVELVREGRSFATPSPPMGVWQLQHYGGYPLPYCGVLDCAAAGVHRATLTFDATNQVRYELWGRGPDGSGGNLELKIYDLVSPLGVQGTRLTFAPGLLKLGSLTGSAISVCSDVGDGACNLLQFKRAP